MIEYPSSLSDLGVAHQTKISLTRKDAATLKSKLWEAQKLAQVVLGRESPQMKSADMLEAIQAYAKMKSELDVLREESAVMRKMLSESKTQTTEDDPAHVEFRSGQDLNEISDDEDTDSEMQEIDNLSEFSDVEQFDEDEDEEEDDDVTIESENGVDLSVSPAVVRTIGTGVLDGLETKIIDWQQKFDKISETHEQYVKECQEDLNEIFINLDELEKTATDPAKLLETKEHLERLVDVVEAFPSKQRIQQLENELKECQIEEQKAKKELSARIEEIKLLRQQKAQKAKKWKESKFLNRLKKIKKAFGIFTQRKSKEDIIDNDLASDDPSTDEASYGPPLPAFVSMGSMFLRAERDRLADLIDAREEEIKFEQENSIRSLPVIQGELSFTDSLPQDENEDDFLLFDSASEESLEKESTGNQDQISEDPSSYAILDQYSEPENANNSFEISQDWIFKEKSPTKSLGSSETKPTVTDSLNESPVSHGSMKDSAKPRRFKEKARIFIRAN